MNRSGEQTAVALMVRTPVPGRVKTRLAVGMGALGACRLYQAMVADIIATIRSTGLPIHLFYDGSEADALPQAWRDGAVRVRRQRGTDIGERMAAAFTDCFADCFADTMEQVILVGSDIPDLDAGVICAARAALAANDAALAPAVDGGYGLIALKRASYRLELFSEIPWSTDRVLPVTLERFATCKLQVCLLPWLRDIDTLEDLLAYREHPSVAAPVTNATLALLLAEPQSDQPGRFTKSL
jgi:uncharacterized protein